MDLIEQNAFTSPRDIEKEEIVKVALNIHSFLMHFINLDYYILFYYQLFFVFLQFGPDPVSSYQ